MLDICRSDKEQDNLKYFDGEDPCRISGFGA